MVHVGAQKKTDAKIVAFIMSQIPAEIATSSSWIKPASEKTLDLMKNIYLEYWAVKFKNMEVPKYVDENVPLYTWYKERGQWKERLQ